MAKMYKLFPKIEVTDAEDYSANSVKRLDWQKHKQFDRSLNGATVSTQEFLDRLSKHKAFSGSVCRSWIDSKNEEITYIFMVNSDNSSTVKLTFAEAAECMGWKSFKLSEDEQNIIPVR